MTILVGQVKGLVAICLILAIIPFISFFSMTMIDCKKQLPLLITQDSRSHIVKIQDSDWSAIYFVEPGLTVNDLLRLTYGRESLSRDSNLKNGIKIIKHDVSGKTEHTLGEMDAAERLALGIQVNLNQVTEDDLLLIPGIGEATAQRILEMRHQSGRFVNMKQLMEIKGIKEKKLAHLKKYLYIE